MGTYRELPFGMQFSGSGVKEEYMRAISSFSGQLVTVMPYVQVHPQWLSKEGAAYELEISPHVNLVGTECVTAKISIGITDNAIIIFECRNDRLLHMENIEAETFGMGGR